MKELLLVEGAKKPEDIFGVKISPKIPIALQELKDKYRALRTIHPDHFDGAGSAADRTKIDRHTIAFKKLTEMYDAACELVSTGMYGKARAILTLTSKNGTCEIFGPVLEITTGNPVQWSSVAQFFEGSHNNQPVLVKIGVDQMASKLMKNEIKIFETLLEDLTITGMPGRFMQVIDSFEAVISAKNRVVTVIKHPGKIVSLQEIYNLHRQPSRVETGIDLRHLAWMWRRTLETLMHFEEKGYVHAGLVPSQILFKPESHGFFIADLCHAVKAGTKVDAIAAAWEQLYPPEIRDKKKAVPVSDTYLAARAMLNCMDKQDTVIAKMFTSYFNAASFENVSKRTESALILYKRFDELIHNRLCWKKEFLVLDL